MQELSFQVQSIESVLSPNNLSGEGSLVDQTYQELRKNIIHLKLAPEQPLVEKDIATVFGISKTPVREALIRLQKDKLVNVVPKSGSYVSPVSLERYFEASFVRESLEVGCIKRLAEKGVTLVEEVKLRSIINQQKLLLDTDPDNYIDFFNEDEKLHKSFFEYAGIIGVWDLLNGAKAEIDRVRHLKRMLKLDRKQQVYDEHSEIVEAVIRRDPEKAQELLRFHIDTIETKINGLAENPEFLESIEMINDIVKTQSKNKNRI